MAKRVKGISFLNPVDVEEGYLRKCAEYAIAHGVTHFELIGPTHSPIKGNCDGMMFYRKYSEFNSDKDREYVEYCERCVNEVLDMIEPYGIKSYYWHHELEVPLRFDEVYPEIHNSDGDVEVTHPRIKDFLENKIEDFFYTYPKMSGIVLTLHETRIPLLKLKNQKLGKVERVKYVTEILYNACKRLGKELIVRPFASIAGDYNDLMSAYEQISSDLVVCDKWTKYDWSLVLPDNDFFNRIRNNPLMVETDIFGEYFGKGFLPLMLKDHIVRKFAYCEGYEPKGYVSRIDREGHIPFGTPNEVNLEIMDAALDGRDVDEAIREFFAREYGEYGETVRLAMEGTEQLQVKAMYAEGYPLHFLSLFPRVASLKLLYKVFRDDNEGKSSDWQFPKGLDKIHPDVALDEKREAIRLSAEKLALIRTLEGKLDDEKYYSLYMRFLNLNLVARIWEKLTELLFNLKEYFDNGSEKHLDMVYENIARMKEVDDEGYATLGKDYYCEALHYARDEERKSSLHYLDSELKFAIDMEVCTLKALKAEGLCDFVIAGGFCEGHNLKREPNFSFPMVLPDGVCRTAGSERGKAWSVLKAHGWVSYDMAVREGEENTLIVLGKGQDGHFSIDLSVDGEITRYAEDGEGILEFVHKFTPAPGVKSVTVRIDRNSDSMPYIYTLKMK